MTSAGTVKSETQGIYVASTGTVWSKACGIFCDECRDRMSETREISAAIAGAVAVMHDDG